MPLRCRQISKEGKLQVLRAIDDGKSFAQAAREYEVNPTTIIDWHQRHGHYSGQTFEGNCRSETDEAKIAELKRKIGQLTMKNDLLKEKLSRFEVRMPRARERVDAADDRGRRFPM